MIKISIIIISWNGRRQLLNCLESIEPLRRKRNDVEVIVVDNGSTDHTEELMASRFADLRFKRLDRNYGVSYARNRAIEMARGHYLMHLDNDTIASAEAIEGMEKYMDSHPECGLCACRLTDPDGTPQDNCKRYPGLMEKVANLLHGRQCRYSYPAQMEHPFAPEYLIGACQFFRRTAYEAVGPLDQHIFFGPEDADFCLRIHKKGWQLCYLPQYTIVHLCQRSTNKHPFSKLGRKHLCALLYFYAKHRRIF